ncbi:MAG: DUF481 domain-containing protein [Acidobacteria bacterium]|nr:DUF481 domain-containing protein [Acidobacteriota bacterium]
MRCTRSIFVFCCWIGAAAGWAQTPASKEPPPLWDAQVGATLVGTSGNSETTTFGADLAAHRRWPLWGLETSVSAVRARDRSVPTAERYVGALRVQRTLSGIVSATAGERIERDRLAGINLRSVLDMGLAYALVRKARWALDGVSTFAWTHEDSVLAPAMDDPTAVLQLVSRTPFSEAADATQRLSFYPNFADAGAYLTEAALSAQAALNSHLGLRVDYLWRRSNAPVPGFVKNDGMLTASVVMRWRAEDTIASDPAGVVAGVADEAGR